MNKRDLFISLACNFANTVLTAISVAGFFISRGSGNMQVTGARCFRYFTVDSNILAGLSSVCLVIFCVMNIGRKEAYLPQWVFLFKFTGTAAVTLTFLTVMFFLGPTMGYGMMFTGSSLYMHLINPLLCIISFVLFEKSGSADGKKCTWLGVLPTIFYGAVYVYKAIIMKKWPDFYGFNAGGLWFISLPLMLAASWMIAVCLWKLNRSHK